MACDRVYYTVIAILTQLFTLRTLHYTVQLSEIYIFCCLLTVFHVCHVFHSFSYPRSNVLIVDQNMLGKFSNCYRFGNIYCNSVNR